MPKTILVVEDSSETLFLVRTALEEAGHTPVCHDCIATAANYLKGSTPDMMILDVNLPDGNGLDLAAKARRRSETAATPIIALTGRDEMAFKRRAFSCGVDHYLIKPIEVEELLLWVGSLFRRIDIDKGAAGGEAALIKVGFLEIDKGAFLARYKGVGIADLTRREFELLAALVEHSPRVLSREYILSRVWRTKAGENLVDAHAHNLRRKLPEHAALKVQSVPGKGFRYFDI